MMKRKIWLGLRTAAILRHETIHHIEHDLASNERVAVNLGDTSRAKARSLRKAAPVVDVRNGNVVKTTGDTIRFTVTHYRHIDDLGDFIRDDLGKMADVARVCAV